MDIETEIKVTDENAATIRVKATITKGCRSYVRYFEDVESACVWVHTVEDALKQGIDPKEVIGVA